MQGVVGKWVRVVGKWVRRWQSQQGHGSAPLRHQCPFGEYDFACLDTTTRRS
jgi:hypothetical protein